MGLAQLALVFPGQGAQAPGMGRSLVEGGCSTDLLAIAAEEGLDLERLLVGADAGELRRTENAQPALFYTGVAVARLLAERGVLPAFAAGHSLGEYCALVAVGAISADDGMRLVMRRARAMADAPPGTMAAILGLDSERLAEVCGAVTAGGEVCVVANDNSPGQQVISGTGAGVAEVSRRARQLGARKVVPLEVGGAFHSPLMERAAARFAAEVKEIEVADPGRPVGSGALGRLVTTAAAVREGLEIQLRSPVRWTELVRALEAAGATRFVECGPGQTLSGLIRRIISGAQVIQVPGPAEAALLAGAGSA